MPSDTVAYATGSRITLLGLVAKDHLNAKNGTIRAFAEGRYSVDVDDEEVLEGLTEANVQSAPRNGATVTLVALASRPELNGTSGTVRKFDVDRGRYTVQIAGSTEKMNIKPANLREIPREEGASGERAKTGKKHTSGKKKKGGWGNVTFRDLALLNAGEYQQSQMEIHKIIPEDEGGEAAGSVFNYVMMYKDLSSYIEEFNLHHDPRVIRIIGVAYFLAFDACKLSVLDPTGWQKKTRSPKVRRKVFEEFRG